MTKHGPAKILIFVSTGRCGTTRLAEILNEKLDPKLFSITHQGALSRISNIIGNISYYTGGFEKIKKSLYLSFIQKHCSTPYFISTDPLTSMIIPPEIAESPDTSIIHLQRNHLQFAQSMFRFSRKRPKSFIAHNLIPFWQPHLFPLENLCSNSIIDTYSTISHKKNTYFRQLYSNTVHYRTFSMQDIFSHDVLNKILKKQFDVHPEISIEDLTKKSNQSTS